MPVAAADVVRLAFEHTKAQLFRPFRYSQWWRLAVVGVLAGELNSGSNFHSSIPSNTSNKQSQFFGGTWPPSLHNLDGRTAALVGILVVLGLALLVVFVYINSVMRFILFDSVIAKECHIRQGWRRRRSEGRLFFHWQIAFLVVSIAAILIVGGTPVLYAWAQGWFAHARAHIVGLVVGGIALLFVFFILVVIMGVVNVLTKDFVVPQMALEGLTAVEGWQRLVSWMKAEKGGYAAYVGIKIALGLAALIVFAIIQIVALLLMLIPVGGIAFAIYLGAKSAGLAWNSATIAVAIVSGGIAVLAVFFVLLLLSTPVAVFFPAYSIYFFAPRYAPLAAAMWPQAPPAATG